MPFYHLDRTVGEIEEAGRSGGWWVCCLLTRVQVLGVVGHFPACHASPKVPDTVLLLYRVYVTDFTSLSNISNWVCSETSKYSPVSSVTSHFLSTLIDLYTYRLFHQLQLTLKNTNILTSTQTAICTIPNTDTFT